MLCKTIKSKRFWPILIVIGMVLLVFGIVSSIRFPDDAHNMNMLMGMFTGMGSAFIAIGIVKLIHYKRTPAEKLKQEQIELNDERNIEILRIAYTIANVIATILFIVMAFTFVWLDYRIPAFFSIGAMCVQVLAFSIAYKYFNGKM